MNDNDLKIINRMLDEEQLQARYACDHGTRLKHINRRNALRDFNAKLIKANIARKHKRAVKANDKREREAQAP